MNDKKLVRVSDVMTLDVKTIEGTQTVDKAVDMMRNSGVSSLVVNRRDEDDEFGMVVVTDIAEQVIGPNKAPERVGIYEIMTKPVLTVSEHMDIRNAVRLLARLHLRRALVTDKQRNLKGIITLRDMVLRHVHEFTTNPDQVEE